MAGDSGVYERTTMNKKGPRIGTQIRGALQKKYNARGKRNGGLTYMYGPKAYAFGTRTALSVGRGRPEPPGADFVVIGDLQLAQVLLWESDPSVLAYRVNTEKDDPYFASVYMRSGSVELVDVVPVNGLPKGAEASVNRRANCEVAADRASQREGVACTHRTASEPDVYTHETRIQSWFLGLPWIAQYRFESLQAASMEVASHLHAERRVTLGALMSRGGGMWVAGALRGVARGTFHSDLNDVAFSWRTVFGERMV